MITVQTLKQIEVAFRQFGYEAEDVFNALLSCYVDTFEIQPMEPLIHLYNKGKIVLNIVFQDAVLKEIIIYQVKIDKQGDHLPVIYQYFLAKRFRDITGKFFTPKDLAAQMASLLPIKKNAIIMDPTCGGGTFLKEVSKQWADTACTLIGNDIDEMLVGLTALTLHICKKKHHHIELICNNLYVPKPDLQQWLGKVDYILANPPFSLPIDSFSSESKLFQLGYRNSDALFIDLAFDLLKTGGRLVCLLPHSIISNKEFEKLRKTVELDWHLSAVLVLPEGVFQPSAQTTTRADIIILDKKEIHNAKKKTIFSNIASIGASLSAKPTDPNDLQTILKSKEVAEILGIL